MNKALINAVPTARVACSKQLLPVENGNIYLTSGTEFQIELYNPTPNVYLAKIILNGVKTSSGLVLRPGERVWLDRFIDDDKKFLFDTYEVDDTTSNKNAVANNGRVKIEFFKESTKEDLSTYIYDWYDSTRVYGPNRSGRAPDVYYSNTSSNITMNYDAQHLSNSESPKIETGRVEKGSKSDQQFVNVDKNFELYASYTCEYHIIPLSQKTVYSYSEVKTYCNKCGRKKRKADVFCPKCGTRY